MQLYPHSLPQGLTVIVLGGLEVLLVITFNVQSLNSLVPFEYPNLVHAFCALVICTSSADGYM